MIQGRFHPERFSECASCKIAAYCSHDLTPEEEAEVKALSLRSMLERDSSGSHESPER
jgi:hypothetical protein